MARMPTWLSHRSCFVLVALFVASAAKAQETPPTEPPNTVPPPADAPCPCECRPAEAQPAQAPAGAPDSPPPAPPPEGVPPFALPTPPGQIEFLGRVSYAIVEPQSPVRFAPGRGSSFATDPGGLYSGSEAPYRGGLQFATAAGYRAATNVSLGLSGSFTKLLSAAVLQDGTADISRLAFGIAPYIRYYVPVSSRVELWGSLAIGFKTDSQSFDRPTSAAGSVQPGKWKMTHEGIAAGLGLGADIRLADGFFLGPSVQYTGVIATGGCLEIQAPNLNRKWCTGDNPSVTRAFSYQQLSVGASARIGL